MGGFNPSIMTPAAVIGRTYSTTYVTSVDISGSGVLVAVGRNSGSSAPKTKITIDGVVKFDRQFGLGAGNSISHVMVFFYKFSTSLKVEYAAGNALDDSAITTTYLLD